LNVELFFNNSDNHDTDGFLSLSNSQVCFVSDPVKEGWILKATDPEDSSDCVELDLTTVLSYKLEKIRSEHGRHRMGRIVLEIPIEDRVKSALGISATTTKYTIKMPREQYDDFCQTIL
jgi:hypothetical protein